MPNRRLDTHNTPLGTAYCMMMANHVVSNSISMCHVCLQAATQVRGILVPEQLDLGIGLPKYMNTSHLRLKPASRLGAEAEA